MGMSFDSHLSFSMLLHCSKPKKFERMAAFILLLLYFILVRYMYVYS